MRHVPAHVCAFTACITVAASAQTTLVEYALPGPLGEVGSVVADAGDVDGDALRDVVSGDLVFLKAFSRASGGMLWAVQNLSPSNSGGRSVSVLPDIDGDGVEDVSFAELVAGESPFGGGVVRLLSGNDGTLIQQLDAPAGLSATNGMREIFK